MLGLIIGGAGSGKSEYAERLAVQLAEKKKTRLIYLATMMSGSKEAGERIERHRRNRAGRGFQTVERPYDLQNLTLPVKTAAAANRSGCGTTVLLEDLGNLLGNEMFLQEGGGSGAVSDGIRHIEEQAGDLIIVGNDIFSDGRRYDEDTQKYLKELAGIQRALAEEAAFVAELVCGYPNILKNMKHIGGLL